MSTARGVVSRLFEKPFGGKTLHSFALQGDQTYYGTGERKVVEEGKAYEFQTRTSPAGRVNVDLSTLRPWDAPADAIQAAPVTAYSGGFKARGGFKTDPDKDQYWKNKEARDVLNDKHRELGATRNTALTLVSLMLANGAVKLPEKQASKEDVIYKLFEHYTEQLLKGTSTEEASSTESTLTPGVGDQGEPEWK